MKEIPKSGLFCDLVWADPVDNDTGALEQDELTKSNEARGCSYYFGYKLAKGFLSKNGLLSVIRAHEAQANGFKMYHWGGQKQFPTVITIFSAPNYCDFYNNKGAVIKFKVPPAQLRTTRWTSSSFYRASTPTCCPTSWTSSSGACPSWPKRSQKCSTTSSSPTANTTKRSSPSLWNYLTKSSCLRNCSASRKHSLTAILRRSATTDALSTTA